MTTIKEIRTTPVAIKDPPLLNLWGVHEPYALRSIVEVELSDGTVGLGETYAGSILLETMRATLADLVGMQAENRLQVTTCARQNAAAYLGDRKGANRKSREVASVIDMALLDAVGKSHGLRACDLLGGAHRGEVAFCGYLFYRFEHHIDAPYEADTWGAATTHEGVVAQALRMRELHGYASYKLKGGVYDAAFEMETLRHLKRAMPTLPLRYDPNCGWDVATTREHLKAAGELLEYLEDPVRGIPDMAALERESTIPFSTNMCVTDFEDLLPAHQQGGPTVILADPHYWGGPTGTVAMGTACGALGLRASMHSNTHLGISLMAMVHSAAATPVLSYPIDTHYHWQTEEVISGGKIEIKNGAIAVPDRPGLGVELDYSQLSILAKQFDECGIRDRDDAGQMRKYDPTWSLTEI